MNKKWIPITAGIINLVGGILHSFISGFILIVFFANLDNNWSIPGDPGPTVLLVEFTGPFLITGILAVICSIFTLRRKKWLFSLFGCVLAFPPFSLALLINTDWETVPFIDLPLGWGDSPGINIAIYSMIILPIMIGLITLVLIYLSRKQFERK